MTLYVLAAPPNRRSSLKIPQTDYRGLLVNSRELRKAVPQAQRKLWQPKIQRLRAQNCADSWFRLLEQSM
jgi:hypothetical protein